MSLDLSALATACEALQLQKLCDQDLKFLQEFNLIFKPIAEGITFVEGSKNMFGSYLPTLFGIRTTLGELHISGDFEYCTSLLHAIKSGFD